MLISAVMVFVEPSREVLSETLLAAGPDSPTLCEGWKTKHLASHLYLRERRPDVGAGLLLKPLSTLADGATNRRAARVENSVDYEQLVADFRAGPGRLSPMRIRSLETSVHLLEYFVHTEDVRRAVDRWAPRALDPEYADALWHELVKRATLLYRGMDVGIVLVRPNGPRHVAKRGAMSVAITGEPGELVMHAHGRTCHALVTFEGQPDAVDLLERSRTGLPDR
ncbi:uncharacterized protein (TIGR03085 family) [Arthrobacter roseus]|nr:uncharacterized protein (TIGR03085 family) [Arthrobacter roseus]